MRALVSSARIAYCRSQFSEALARWEVVLFHVQKYGSFKGGRFTYAVIQLSIYLAYLETGNRNDGYKVFKHAEKFIYKEMRDFWIPILGTI